MIIYRLVLTQPIHARPLSIGTMVIVRYWRDILGQFFVWNRNWGWRGAVITSLKVLSGRRIFYGVIHEGKIIQSGWASIGFCRFYSVEPHSVTLGTLWTDPEFRSRGLATAAKSQIIAFLYASGFERFYADTTPENLPAQRTSLNLGFQIINLPSS